MSEIVEEVRRAYARVGLRLDQPVAYGTYYRLCCAGCGRLVGSVGDRLLPGMADALVDLQCELYAAGLLGCACGHQAARVGAPSGAGLGGPAPGEPSGRARADAAPEAAALWPLWREAYAHGDPLPDFGAGRRPQYRFDEGDPLPEEYRTLLLKMLRHEGEGGQERVAFYFAQPPPLRGPDEPRWNARRERRTTVSYLSEANAVKKPEIREWVRAIRRATSEGASAGAG